MRNKLLGVAVIVVGAGALISMRPATTPETAGSTDPLIGEIMLFAGNFAPRGWALCEGQLLPISSNNALFAILGTTYGGDGRTTFGLPDLRGRVPVQQGRGPGLSPYNLGQKGGVENVTLTTNQMPSHRHTVQCAKKLGDAHVPTGAFPATTQDGQNPYAKVVLPEDLELMNDSMINATGGGQAHENRPPFLALNYCIALQGIFPSRN